MGFIKYLLLAVFLLAGCTSVLEQNYSKKSLEELLPLAEQSDAEAQYRLGEMYRSGEEPQYNEFDEEYYSGKGVRRDDQSAVKWFRKAAEQGHAEAQVRLGGMYYYSGGVPRDYQEALKWFRKAAEQGLAQAQFSSGSMYYKGEGVPQDYQQAAKWYRRAAEQGLARAQYNLGSSYNFGEGVPNDYVLAIKWYNLSAAQGDKGAAEARDKLAKKMNTSQIQEAQRLARNFKPKKENPKK